MHRVRLDPGSRLAQLIDETNIDVNSLHHQAVKTVAPQLKVTGTSEDGVIEALESDDRRFLIAIQWHPEEIDQLPWVQRLFAGFARVASGRG
jgi:putative glutamine amidotransferase